MRAIAEIAASKHSGERMVFTDFKPKFTRRHANQTEVAVQGLKDLTREVRDGT